MSGKGERPLQQALLALVPAMVALLVELAHDSCIDDALVDATQHHVRPKQWVREPIALPAGLSRHLQNFAPLTGEK